MSISPVKIFNQILDEFFIELIEIFPEEKQIQIKYNLFQTLCKANIKKPCTNFMIGSINYLEYIASRDEKIFIGDNKPEILNDIGVSNIWPKCSTNTKDTIWKYIKTLITIGYKIIDMPEDSHPLVEYIINN